MRKRIPWLLSVVVGAFLVHCSGDALRGPLGSRDGGGAGDGMVGDAHGQVGSTTCCTPAPPQFDVLADLTLTGNAPSAPVSVGAYREIVIYVVNATTGCAGGYLEFRPTPSSSFGFTGVGSFTGGRVRVDGSDVRMTAPCNAHVLVAGAR